jgi:5-methylcytosine-specific restriction endonuclease McrA
MKITDKKLLRVEKKCPVCDVSFFVKPSHAHRRKCCSHKCYATLQSKIKTLFICDYCGKEYFRGDAYIKWQKIRGVKNHFCSISCGVKFRPKGEVHPNWNGGISRAYQYGYHSAEYKQWHNNVFERDNFTCQLCNVRGTYLHAHHIKGFSKYPDLRFTLSNGITLCKKCHMEVHSKKCRKINNLQNNLNALAMEDRKKIIPRKALPTQNYLNT